LKTASHAECDPAVPAEFKRRWPDAIEAEAEQARATALPDG
jgi:hypothetical protein